MLTLNFNIIQPYIQQLVYYNPDITLPFLSSILFSSMFTFKLFICASRNFKYRVTHKGCDFNDEVASFVGNPVAVCTYRLHKD